MLGLRQPTAGGGPVSRHAANAEVSVKRTYDAFAPAYDEFNKGYMYERWTGRLLGKAEEAGLQGKRLLDVACGTGLSFVALLERGWQVTGCDISPAMLERARDRVGDAATLVAADMRTLPDLGEFDLIWSLNDSLNYLLSQVELEAALAGMRRNLAPGGIVLFDVNTLTVYRTFFSKEQVVETNGRRLVWKGQMSSAKIEPGSINEAHFEAEGEGAGAEVHRQRHFPEAEVRAALETAGLRCLRVFGELDGDLYPELDEDFHTKAVYLAG
jgi:ubiquinone/menaquinone biosynthesis C-methylase UbiE